MGVNGGFRGGKNATVAFIDIRSATKALRSVHSMGGQPLQITYHEPGLFQSGSNAPCDKYPVGDSPVTGETCGASGSVPLNSNGPIGNSPAAPSTYNSRHQRFSVQHG